MALRQRENRANASSGSILRQRENRANDEGPALETLDYTIRIGNTPTFLYFDLYLYSAYAAHYSTFIYEDDLQLAQKNSDWKCFWAPDFWAPSGAQKHFSEFAIKYFWNLIKHYYSYFKHYVIDQQMRWGCKVIKWDNFIHSNS